MTRNILSFVVALTISLLFSAIIYYYLFLETIDLFGIESITDPEARHGKILLTAFTTSLTILVSAGILRRKKYFAIGFGIPSLIGIVLIVLFAPTFLNKSNYYEPFDKQKWLTTEFDRIKMARQLIRNKELLNLTREEVIEKLGPGQIDPNGLSYKVWGYDCGLDVIFSGERVSDCWIYVKD